MLPDWHSSKGVENENWLKTNWRHGAETLTVLRQGHFKMFSSRRGTYRTGGNLSVSYMHIHTQHKNRTSSLKYDHLHWRCEQALHQWPVCLGMSQSWGLQSHELRKPAQNLRQRKAPINEPDGTLNGGLQKQKLDNINVSILHSGKMNIYTSSTFITATESGVGARPIKWFWWEYWSGISFW